MGPSALPVRCRRQHERLPGTPRFIPEDLGTLYGTEASRQLDQEGGAEQRAKQKRLAQLTEAELVHVQRLTATQKPQRPTQ
jgi:hypothetical protein